MCHKDICHSDILSCDIISFEYTLKPSLSTVDFSSFQTFEYSVANVAWNVITTPTACAHAYIYALVQQTSWQRFGVEHVCFELTAFTARSNKLIHNHVMYPLMNLITTYDCSNGTEIDSMCMIRVQSWKSVSLCNSKSSRVSLIMEAVPCIVEHTSQ